MKTEKILFWISLIITVIFLLISIIPHFCTNNDDPNSTFSLIENISISIFSGAFLTTINSIVRIISDRRNAIETILFEVFQLKQIYNRIYISENELEFVNSCRGVEIHFLRFENAYESLVWLAFNKRRFTLMSRSVFQFCQGVIGSLGQIEDGKAFPFKQEQAGVCSLGESELGNALVIWEELCEKYVDSQQRTNYEKTDSVFSKGVHKNAKTIKEMIERSKSNGKTKI